MKKILFLIISSIMLSSCLDHLLESDKKELPTESIIQKTNIKSKGDEERAVPIEINSSGRFPMTSQRLLTFSELQQNNYSKSDLEIMRNEIFARHGYKFISDGDLDKCFRKQKWYQPKYSDVSSLLSELEKQNVDLILKASEAISKSSTSIQDNIPELEEEAGGYGNIMVENLRLRDKPDLDGETIALLAKNSFVNVKEQSSFKTTIELNGNKISDFWFKIISEEGAIGWVHGCCIDVTWP